MRCGRVLWSSLGPQVSIFGEKKVGSHTVTRRWSYGPSVLFHYMQLR